MALLFICILIGGWYYPLLGYFIPLCMLFGIGIGIFSGRKWCNWFCPRGSFYDVVAKEISPKRNIPMFFKSNPFRLATIILLMSLMILNLIARWPDPYKIGKFFVVLITITTALGLFLAMIFHQRTWCSFCPIGSIIKWISKNNLKINSNFCVDCKLCERACPIQIKPRSFKGKDKQEVADSDCLRCNLCIFACSKKALFR